MFTNKVIKVGLLMKGGKLEWVDEASIHRMTQAQAEAFILFSENEIRRHQQDIINIQKVVARIRTVFKMGEEK